MECTVETVLAFIKESLIKDNPSINLNDLKDLDYDVDLVQYGIESIMILSIITELEAVFKKKVSLEDFEKFDYIVSAKSITNNLNNDKS